VAPPPRAGVASRHVIALRFNDDELAALDRLKMPGESRAALVRRLLAIAADDPEWAARPPPAPPDLGDLGILEDDLADQETADAPGPDNAVKRLVRAMVEVVAGEMGPAREPVLVEVRRAAEELLAERRR
jgi:hypothetical protein